VEVYNALENGVEEYATPYLLLDKFRGTRVDTLHADRVLRRERGYGAGPVASARGECLQVGLDACAAAGVGARDGEDDWAVEVHFDDDKMKMKRGRSILSAVVAVFNCRRKPLSMNI
jgi:hypothetical protein